NRAKRLARVPEHLFDPVPTAIDVGIVDRLVGYGLDLIVQKLVGMRQDELANIQCRVEFMLKVFRLKLQNRRQTLPGEMLGVVDVMGFGLGAVSHASMRERLQKKSRRRKSTGSWIVPSDRLVRSHIAWGKVIKFRESRLSTPGLAAS